MIVKPAGMPYHSISLALATVAVLVAGLPYNPHFGQPAGLGITQS
jgi:hypothetical protein